MNQPRLYIPDVSDLDALAAGLAYANGGWYQGPVRPRKGPGGKNPGSVLGDKWQHQTSRDPQQIVAWHAGADYGIFLHAGRSGAVIADVDHPDKLPAVLAQAIGDLRAPFQSTRLDQPRRGHAVFACPPGRMFGNSTGRLGKGWGEIRGANGVIIAAPTVHPEGGCYHWERTGDVPELPPELAELLDDAQAAEDAATDAQVQAFTGAYTANARPTLLTGVLRFFLDKVAAGESRHESALAATVWAAKEARCGYYPAGPAFAAIGQAFKNALNGERPDAAEYAGIVAWAVAQANAADLADVRRIAERNDARQFPAYAVKRHEVQAGNRNPVDIADDVGEHLLATNDPPRLFSMGATAVVFSDDDGSLTPLDPDGWLYYVARRVNFYVSGRNGELRIVQPPTGAMKLIPSVVIPKLPPLDGIAATPYLDRQGNVVSEDGYNADTRLILHCGDFQLPAVSVEPSAEDVAQAVKRLLEEWLGDFPFKGPADQANAVAVLLTLTGRMFFALAPLFVFDASTAGSGKGLLVTTISLIATGEAPHLMELPADGEEQRKKITSALLAGHELIVWDESHVIAGRTLAAILTAEKYSDRLLGGNKLISVVNRFTQVALGNNVEVWGDVKRRVVPSRLVPDVEHPEDRSDFRHPDLEVWVRSHRGELLAAVLTIWRNWIAKDRPSAAAGMGSFERWARTVGGALQAAGIDGFRTNTSGWLSDSDDDDGWGTHLAELRARFATTNDGWFTVAVAADAIEAGYLKRPPVKRDPEKTVAELIGYGYRKIREKWYGDLRLVRSEDRNSASGGRQWTVVKREDRPNHHQHGQDHQQSPDHPDDADHQHGAPERRDTGWPAGTIGDEVNQ